MLIAYNPTISSVTSILVEGKADISLGRELGIPVDAITHLPLQSDIPSLTRDMIFKGSHQSGMTILDSIRLFLFVNSLKQNGFHVQTISLPASPTVTEKLLPGILQDSTIYFDNESIAVVNATGVSGIGTEVAHLLTIVGMNVISVTTAQEDEDTTSIVATQPTSYTVMRMQRIMHATATSATQTAHISDITLTVGKKSLRQLQ